ncbi:hypothetical protein [Pseudactinotalea sp. Z1748]|uniref:hypothetical protein n=1 Tax=Pseudactinotalea sp. Z1748 TaxID=3413027 RepID=UPI003C797942
MAFLIAGNILIAVALAGWLTFRFLYKPWRLSGHNKGGRHLIRTADSMIALLGVSLLARVVPIPLVVMQAVTLAVLAWLCWVAWERVALLRRERRRRQRRAET